MTPKMPKDIFTILKKHPKLLQELRRNIVQGSWDAFWGLLILGIKRAGRELGKCKRMFQGTSEASRHSGV